jgi:hypothetical protein
MNEVSKNLSTLLDLESNREEERRTLRAKGHPFQRADPIPGWRMNALNGLTAIWIWLIESETARRLNLEDRYDDALLSNLRESGIQERLIG